MDRDLLGALVEHHCGHPATIDPAVVLADDFVFDNAVSGDARSDYLLGIACKAPWEQLRILGVLIQSENAAVFFEGVDPVTGLAHQSAWLVYHANGRIRRIRQISSIVNGAQLCR